MILYLVLGKVKFFDMFYGIFVIMYLKCIFFNYKKE